MAVVATVATTRFSPTFLWRTRIEVYKNQRDISFQQCLPFSCSCPHRLYSVTVMKASAAEHFHQPNKITSHLSNLADSVWSITPRPIKEFPWNKAKDLVLVRLLLLGKTVAKWSLLLFFIVSFVLDVYLAVAKNKELTIPLGLFIGVMMAAFLNESSLEFFQKSMKDREASWLLVGVGSIFILVKYLALYLNIHGRVLFSQIGNGGLMQVLWLVQRWKQNEDGKYQDE